MNTTNSWVFPSSACRQPPVSDKDLAIGRLLCPPRFHSLLFLKTGSAKPSMPEARSAPLGGPKNSKQRASSQRSLWVSIFVGPKPKESCHFGTPKKTPIWFWTWGSLNFLCCVSRVPCWKTDGPPVCAGSPSFPVQNQARVFCGVPVRLGCVQRVVAFCESLSTPRTQLPESSPKSSAPPDSDLGDEWQIEKQAFEREGCH